MLLCGRARSTDRLLLFQISRPVLSDCSIKSRMAPKSRSIRQVSVVVKWRRGRLFFQEPALGSALRMSRIQPRQVQGFLRPPVRVLHFNQSKLNLTPLPLPLPLSSRYGAVLPARVAVRWFRGARLQHPAFHRLLSGGSSPVGAVHEKPPEGHSEGGHQRPR